MTTGWGTVVVLVLYATLSMSGCSTGASTSLSGKTPDSTSDDVLADTADEAGEDIQDTVPDLPDYDALSCDELLEAAADYARSNRRCTGGPYSCKRVNFPNLLDHWFPDELDGVCTDCSCAAGVSAEADSAFIERITWLFASRCGGIDCCTRPMRVECVDGCCQCTDGCCGDCY